MVRHFAADGLRLAVHGPLSGTDCESGERSRLLRSAFAKITATPRQTPTTAEGATTRYMAINIDTLKARYVWLPIRFDRHDRPTIEWRDEWRLDESD